MTNSDLINARVGAMSAGSGGVVAVLCNPERKQLPPALLWLVLAVKRKYEGKKEIRYCARLFVLVLLIYLVFYLLFSSFVLFVD